MFTISHQYSRGAPEDMFDIKTKLTEYTDQQMRQSMYNGLRDYDYLTDSPTDTVAYSDRSHGRTEVIKMEPVRIQADTVHINQMAEIPSMYYPEMQQKSMSFGQDPDAASRSNKTKRLKNNYQNLNGSRIIVINPSRGLVGRRSGHFAKNQQNVSKANTLPINSSSCSHDVDGVCIK